MRRALKLRVWLSALLATGACLGPLRAVAQTCESARPTDATGAGVLARVLERYPIERVAEREAA